MPICLTPHLDGDPIKLDKAILLIGRHPSCDIILLSSRKVSRIHCCVAQAGNRLLIRDLGSTNGVAVNGERVEEAEIRLGDDVTIGDLEFYVGDGTENAPTRRAGQIHPEDDSSGEKFSGMDSAETPLLPRQANGDASAYGLATENDDSEPDSGEGSFAEANDSHVDVL